MGSVSAGHKLDWPDLKSAIEERFGKEKAQFVEVLGRAEKELSALREEADRLRGASKETRDGMASEGVGLFRAILYIAAGVLAFAGLAALLTSYFPFTLLGRAMQGSESQGSIAAHDYVSIWEGFALAALLNVPTLMLLRFDREKKHYGLFSLIVMAMVLIGTPAIAEKWTLVLVGLLVATGCLSLLIVAFGGAMLTRVREVYANENEGRVLQGRIAAAQQEVVALQGRVDDLPGRLVQALEKERESLAKRLLEVQYEERWASIVKD